jgi:hypothetical protein
MEEAEGVDRESLLELLETVLAIRTLDNWGALGPILRTASP